MTAGQLLQIVKDVIVLFETKGVLKADGTFDNTLLDTLQEDVAFGVAVEGILKKHGLVVPDKVDKFVQLLPLLSSLFA